ncbi:hypothetical protein EV646_103194 [Kribbella antiqua]|uniref:Tetratricopeptide repeat protein n=1 Tax=Kribbella antiqua TaxID=2512217 RepID=A0A4R2IXK2_9ACTN|nr:hypothetical protein [Kribbella antiqua]TCO49216.1 hypothetical protein EV646_103194 [Kribbella antiqua]
MTDAPPEEERRPEDRDRESRRRGGFFGIVAIASALLSGIVGEKLAQTLDSGGWLELAGYTMTAACAVICGIYYIPPALRERRRRRQQITAVAEATGLHLAAEEAERSMVALGSGAGGMAAAEWFSTNESGLRELLQNEKPRVDTADDLARICDALEVWYLRRYDAEALLELSDFLTAVADGCGRRDLAELAAARAATAFRLMGDVETATTRLGISDSVATHSRTAAALTTRRQVERALLHLARAERSPAGNDREEAVLNARDRLEDARLSRPGPDLAAEVAIQINLAVVHLYQQDAEGALDQLRPAVARATAAGDVSGQAHASELMGVAAWMQGSRYEARRWWQHAEHLYAEIDEIEGLARCLQHLGSAEVVAGSRERGRELLEQSAVLRGSESELLTQYLEAAREPTQPPEVTEEASHQTAVSWIRRLLARLRNHFRH